MIPGKGGWKILSLENWHRLEANNATGHFILKLNLSLKIKSGEPYLFEDRGAGREDLTNDG
jgi:hypothetical protein